MSTAVAERMPSPIAEVRQQLDQMRDQFAAALPAHIPVERFARVLMTAIQNNSDLLNVSRRSLWNACMKAAQDGLLPDGREGAIVPYKGEAQWLPMVAGIRKKARNSGEITTWDVHAVYENDHFEFELGDEPFIKHRPALTNRGAIIAVYSVATLKGGEKSRDVMSIEEVEKIRAKSPGARGGKSPWNDPTFYPEMAKKTVARRHSKVLPASTDLDDLIRRDDALYDLDGARQESQTEARRPTLHTMLDRIAQRPPETIEGQVNADDDGQIPPAEQEDVSQEPAPAAEPGATDAIAAARIRGEKDYARGIGRQATPKKYREPGREAELAAWIEGHDTARAEADAQDAEG